MTRLNSGLSLVDAAAKAADAGFPRASRSVVILYRQATTHDGHGVDRARCEGLVPWGRMAAVGVLLVERVQTIRLRGEVDGTQRRGSFCHAKVRVRLLARCTLHVVLIKSFRAKNRQQSHALLIKALTGGSRCVPSQQPITKRGRNAENRNEMQAPHTSELHSLSPHGDSEKKSFRSVISE
jgi:hypothetical protein